MKPLFGEPADVEARLPTENPVEMLELYNVRPDDFKMFICFGERDQFNGNSEARNFLCEAGKRGITAVVTNEPDGKHNKRTGMKFFDRFCAWLSPLLTPYAPQ